MSVFYATAMTEYCEKKIESLIVEPFNFFSNFAFYIAVFFAYKLLKTSRTKDPKVRFLINLLVFIGIGSSLFHSNRNPITHALDYIPIFTFFLVLIFVLIKKLTKSDKVSFVLTSCFLLVQILLSYLFPDILNGSIRHFINLIFFAALIKWLYIKKLFNKNLIIAISLYAIAIFFRTVDNLVCNYIHIGTHFLWHIYTASASFFTIKYLVTITDKN